MRNRTKQRQVLGIMVLTALMQIGCGDDGGGGESPDAGEPTEAGDGSPDETPGCTDRQKNNGETAVDCGGPCQVKCALGSPCTTGVDCTSGVCPSGICVECETALDCPGTDSECRVRICEKNACGTMNQPENLQLSTQTAGDCKERRCDAHGNVVTVYKDHDYPRDGMGCTLDLCTDGVPSNPLAERGAGCAEGEGRVCDGNGACVVCNVPSDCPDEDTECQQRTCTDNACGISFSDLGRRVSEQTNGDCHSRQCDGNGAIENAVDDNDVPVDGRECTEDVCNQGTPYNPPVLMSMTCAGGSQVCNGGVCGQCDFPEDCPGKAGAPDDDDACWHRTCAAHVCGIENDPATSKARGQPAGDCRVIYCDGSGGLQAPEIDSTDVPDDGNDCTVDRCSVAGVPSNEPVQRGQPCAQAQGGACSNDARCLPTFLVLRVGDGSTPFSTASVPVFLERRYFDSSEPLQTVRLPTAQMDDQYPLTLVPSTERDGMLSLSVNGRYATLLGYASAPGGESLSISPNPPNHRVVARIDGNYNVDTSTLLTTAFYRNNSRCATSVDGNAFWVCGASDLTGGIYYIPWGAKGGETRITSANKEEAPISVRAARIFAGQLYASSGDKPFSGIFAVGKKLPTISRTPALMLPGQPTENQSPLEFVMFDRDPLVPGLDTLYYADDRNEERLGEGNGIQKWTFDGQTWQPVARFRRDETGAVIAVGMKGLTGMLQGDSVILIATTAHTHESQNRILMYQDDGSPDPIPQLLATAQLNTAYRGVALAPNP